MHLVIHLLLVSSIPLAYLMGKRRERLHWNQRLELSLERSYLNRTYYGRCHERL
jgi:hypothetical protein